MNLIGEHTDYNGGYVFPCALSFGTYLLIRNNGQKVVRFRSLNQLDAVEVPLEKLTTRLENSWANYLIGVFAQFIKKGVNITEGFDILIWGYVPVGAGLSSSASLEVATAYALNDQLKTNFDRIELAKMS